LCVIWAYHHLLHLLANSQALDNLEIFQASQDLMLNLELGLHAESSALLDGEGFALERLDSTRGPQVNDDVFSTFDLKTEREDDTFAGVVGVRDVLALTEAEGSFPLL
jgi:hypothetical protein